MKKKQHKDITSITSIDKIKWTFIEWIQINISNLLFEKICNRYQFIWTWNKFSWQIFWSISTKPILLSHIVCLSINKDSNFIQRVFLEIYLRVFEKYFSIWT